MKTAPDIARDLREHAALLIQVAEVIEGKRDKVSISEGGDKMVTPTRERGRKKRPE